MKENMHNTGIINYVTLKYMSMNMDSLRHTRPGLHSN